MSELSALKWYFGSAVTMALYQLDYTVLRAFGFKDKELDRILELARLVDIDAGKIINAIEPVYRDGKCREYISTRSMPKRKHGNKWEFQYMVLRRKADPKKHKKAAYIGVSIELNSNDIPAVILWTHCPDVDSSKCVREKIDSGSEEAVRIWGPNDGKNMYVLGEVHLSKKRLHFKSIEEISKEFSALVTDKLLKGGRYSLITKLCNVAERR